MSVIDSNVGPAVLGIVRPRILLPAAVVSGKTAGQLEPLIAHELVHIRRGDLFRSMFQALATNLFWFHPLIWIVGGLVTRESERCCDEETVVGLQCEPATYARGLLDILEQKQKFRNGFRFAPVLPGVRPIDVTSARLERVMRLGNGSYRRTPPWVWFTMLVCGSIVLPGAALIFAQESSDISNAPDDRPTVQPSTHNKSDVSSTGTMLPLVQREPSSQSNAKNHDSPPPLVVTYKQNNVRPFNRCRTSVACLEMLAANRQLTSFTS